MSKLLIPLFPLSLHELFHIFLVLLKASEALLHEQFVDLKLGLAVGLSIGELSLLRSDELEDPVLFIVSVLC